VCVTAMGISAPCAHITTRQTNGCLSVSGALVPEVVGDATGSLSGCEVQQAWGPRLTQRTFKFSGAAGSRIRKVMTLVTYQDYAWVSLGNVMKAKQSKAKVMTFVSVGCSETRE
jgi:hypothetical protein